MNDDSELFRLRTENAVLNQSLSEKDKALYDALGALSSMWNQYCPPPWTHQFMNAGEDAEEILMRWKLMRQDETSIEISGAQIDDDIPAEVLALLPSSRRGT